MNATISAVLVAASAFLQGCSTPAPEQLTRIPPPEVSRALPLEVPMPGHPDMPPARVCKLGASCMELDPRPFEACLVSTRHCVDKALEPVEVKTPRNSDHEALVAVAAREEK